MEQHVFLISKVMTVISAVICLSVFFYLWYLALNTNMFPLYATAICQTLVVIVFVTAIVNRRRDLKMIKELEEKLKMVKK